jgi:alkylation response protein AidB-like acyl-CoA dehydrogenase
MQAPRHSISPLPIKTHEPDEQELLRRAKSLVPSLRAKSLEITRNRALPESVMAELKKLGLMQLGRPAEYGGRDIGMDTIFRIGTALAAGDAATAWVYVVTNSHDHLAGLFPKSVQDAYWASAHPLCASSYIPTGKAEPADGGYRLTGKWSFCSGIDFCDWVVVGAITGMLPGDPPAPDLQLFMLEKSQVKVVDDWHVMGLSGTGSKSIQLDNVFVPAERVLHNSDVMAGKTPGAALHSNPMYKMSVWPVVGFAIISPATGIARGALEYVTADCREKSAATHHAMDARRLNAAMHLAEAAALIDSAELLFERSLTDTFDLISAGKPLPVELRVRTRRDQAFLVGLCRKALDILMALSGGRGIRDEGVVQRALRDVYAISAHPGGNWDAASASYGSVLLGGQPTEMFA